MDFPQHLLAQNITISFTIDQQHGQIPRLGLVAMLSGIPASVTVVGVTVLPGPETLILTSIPNACYSDKIYGCI